MNRTVIYTLILFLFGSVASAQVSDVSPGMPVPDYPQLLRVQAQSVGFPSVPPLHYSEVGYYQPVKIQGPKGSKIAFAANGQFTERKTAPYAVGLLVGADYRAKITDIPLEPGKEIFPTVKVIARTYPPEGYALEYPIIIEITQEDIKSALDGKFITRVIYLEHPNNALPVRSDLGSQLTTDIKTGDPINYAATLGQPVAVLYLGGRIPNSLTVDTAFFHGSPSWAEITKTPSGRFEVSFFGIKTPLPRSAPPRSIPYQVGNNRNPANF